MKLEFHDGKRETVLHLKTEQDVKDFIADIRTAMRHSKKNGGQYYAYRRDDLSTLIISIHLPGI